MEVSTFKTKIDLKVIITKSQRHAEFKMQCTLWRTMDDGIKEATSDHGTEA